MRRAIVIVPVVLVLLVAVACGSSAGVASTSTSTSSGLADSLEGRTFLSTSVTDAGAARPLAGDQPIRVRFDDGELAANPGCNHLGASFSLDDNRLVTDSVGTTDMACLEIALMEQDTWFAAILAARPTLTLVGDQLTLTSGDTVIVFVDRESADPDRPLVGTDWVLESIIEGQGASSVPVGATASLSIPDDSRLDWQGCNTGGAALSSMDATSFTVGEMTQSLRGCPSPSDEVDAALTTVLQGRVTYTIEGPVLQIVNGERGLGFRAR